MPYLDQDEQQLVDLIKELLNPNTTSQSIKCVGRKIIAKIIDKIHLEKTNSNHTLYFSTKLDELVNNNIYKKEFKPASLFIYKEGSNFGCHTDNKPTTSAGSIEYTSCVIQLIKPIVDWYFYNYSHYKKEELEIEGLFKTYYHTHYPFLSKQNNKWLNVTSLLGVAFFIATIVLCYGYYNLYKQNIENSKNYKSAEKNYTNTLNILKDSITKTNSIIENYQIEGNNNSVSKPTFVNNGHGTM